MEISNTANLDDLLDFVSNRIYLSMVDIHESLATHIGNKAADDLIINALAVNLGHAIGQMDPKSQRRYATVARQTIKEHMLAGTMLRDQYMHGNIGHA